MGVKKRIEGRWEVLQSSNTPRTSHVPICNAQGKLEAYNYALKPVCRPPQELQAGSEIALEQPDRQWRAAPELLPHHLYINYHLNERLDAFPDIEFYSKGKSVGDPGQWYSQEQIVRYFMRALISQGGESKSFHVLFPGTVTPNSVRFFCPGGPKNAAKFSPACQKLSGYEYMVACMRMI